MPRKKRSSTDSKEKGSSHGPVDPNGGNKISNMYKKTNWVEVTKMKNSKFWAKVLSKNISEIFSRPLDLKSQHLHRTGDPLKMDKALIADFFCKNKLPKGNGICGRKWDSTSVTVTFFYNIEDRRKGKIHIKEFGQKCQKCPPSAAYVMPSFDEQSADRAAAKLKLKILEKFYGEMPEDREENYQHRERKKPHDSANCEACVKGVCVAGREGRGGNRRTDDGRRFENVKSVVARGPKVGTWFIKLNGSKEENKLKKDLNEEVEVNSGPQEESLCNSMRRMNIKK